MAVDWSGVTVSWDRDPPNYIAGETLTATVAGQVVVGEQITETWGPYTIPVNSETGLPSTVFVSAYQVTRGDVTKEDVFIDADAGAVLTLNGKDFTVSEDRRSISAVA